MLRALVAALFLPVLAAAQPVHVGLTPALADELGGYARAALGPDGTADLRWPGHTETIQVADGAVMVAGRQVLLTPHNERISVARVPIDGLGTVEVRSFAGRAMVLYVLADVRRGTIEVDGAPLAVELRRATGATGFGLGSTLGLDLDGDGTFRTAAEADTTGQLRARETAAAARPRRVGRETLEIDSVATDGSALWLRRTDRAVGIEPGMESPDAALRSLSDDTLRLADFRGKTVVLSWWATTCPYCAEERPMLNETAHRYADDEDVVWFAVAMEGRSTVVPFLEQHPYVPEVVVITPEAEAAFAAATYPRHTVLAPDGRIVFDEDGVDEGRDADLHAAIALARGE